MLLFRWKAHKLYRTQRGCNSRLHPTPTIVGSPRSGTTLLRFVLDAHPELAIPPETGFLALAPKIRGSGNKLRGNFLHALISYPQPIPAWPGFEIPENVVLARLGDRNSGDLLAQVCCFGLMGVSWTPGLHGGTLRELNPQHAGGDRRWPPTQPGAV